MTLRAVVVSRCPSSTSRTSNSLRPLRERRVSMRTEVSSKRSISQLSPCPSDVFGKRVRSLHAASAPTLRIRQLVLDGPHPSTQALCCSGIPVAFAAGLPCERSRLGKRSVPGDRLTRRFPGLSLPVAIYVLCEYAYTMCIHNVPYEREKSSSH